MEAQAGLWLDPIFIRSGKQFTLSIIRAALFSLNFLIVSWGCTLQPYTPMNKILTSMAFSAFLVIYRSSTESPTYNEVLAPRLVIAFIIEYGLGFQCLRLSSSKKTEAF